MTRPRLRTRLALLHAGLNFACGVLLLAFVDLPFLTVGHAVPAPPADPGIAARTTTNLAEVLPYSAAVLPILAVLSLGLGWLIAGRALRPLHTITSTARLMSADSLGARPPVPAAYREFTELADTLDDLRRRLDDAFTAQRQFVANASHELRTPLTVQRTLLQVTLADPDATADTFRAAGRQLLALGRQQEELISALLTLAAGDQPIEDWAPFDLAEVTRKVVSDHGDQARARGVRVHITLDPVTVVGDQRLAGRLVTNLIDNAIRHNDPGGTVEITTSRHGWFTVTNTGPAIPAAEIDRLFRPFQRIGADRTDQTAGYGLGLAIVAAIARAHRAPLTARPGSRGGLHVTVDLGRRSPDSSPSGGESR